MLYQGFSTHTSDALERASQLAKKLQHREITPYHLLFCLLREHHHLIPIGQSDAWEYALDCFLKRNMNVSRHPVQQPEFSASLQATFAHAERLRAAREDLRLHTRHLWDALVLSKTASIDITDVLNRYPLLSPQPSTQPQNTNATAGNANPNQEPSISVLAEYCDNFTHKARLGSIDPMIGREQELELLVQVMLKRKKNNPLLVGQAGVGKTALVEGLAQRLVHDPLPALASLAQKEIVSLRFLDLMGGTKLRGELEDRLKNLVRTLTEAAGQIILFIDEIHNLVGTGAQEGAGDLANLLKPILARGEIRIIGATTLGEYKRFIERDPALKRRFEVIHVPEPTLEQTLHILQKVKPLYETTHQVSYEEEVIQHIPFWSKRYYSDNQLPDSALNLLDNLGAYRRTQTAPAPTHTDTQEPDPPIPPHPDTQQENNPTPLPQNIPKSTEPSDALTQNQKISITTVTLEDATFFIARSKRIDVSVVRSDPDQRFLSMESVLAPLFLGQEEAFQQIQSRFAMHMMKRPQPRCHTLLLSGSPNTDVLDIAEAIASHFYPLQEQRYSLDLAGFQDAETIHSLKGPPRGIKGFDEGGELTEFIKLMPQCCLLLSHPEKANPAIWSLLKPIFHQATITDSAGATYPLQGALVLLVSHEPRLLPPDLLRLLPTPIPFVELNDQTKRHHLKQTLDSFAQQLEQDYRVKLVFEPSCEPPLQEIASFIQHHNEFRTQLTQSIEAPLALFLARHDPPYPSSVSVSWQEETFLFCSAQE